MSALRVLADVGVGRAVENWFRQNGHDARSVRDRNSKMADADILAWAVAKTRLVVRKSSKSTATSSLASSRSTKTDACGVHP